MKKIGKFKTFKKTLAGFTLVEAIVVLLVFGILMTGVAAVFSPINQVTGEMRRDALADMTADTIQSYVRHSIQNAHDLSILSDGAICTRTATGSGEARALVFDSDGRLYEVWNLAEIEALSPLEKQEFVDDFDTDDDLKVSTLLDYVRNNKDECSVFGDAFYSRRSVIVPTLIATPNRNELNFTLTVRANSISDYTVVTVKTYIIRFFNQFNVTDLSPWQVMRDGYGGELTSDGSLYAEYSDGSYIFSSSDGSSPLIMYYHLINI